jgi:uncharacterized protein (DUF608 family)
MTWHFPARVYGSDPVGNFYATLWDGAANVAAELAAPARLAAVVNDIAAHHGVFFGSSLPDWLADTLVNQFSHARQMLFTQEGYLRMDEGACMHAVTPSLLLYWLAITPPSLPPIPRYCAR